MDRSTITLIGPLGVGKSTLAQLLSQKLALPRCCYDDLKLAYLEDAGFKLSEAHRIRDADCIHAMCMYTNQFGIDVLERVINEHVGYVIDFGAGSYCFENPAEIARASKSFAPISNAFLLLPSDNLRENILPLPGVREKRYMNTYFIMHPMNETLSKTTVYTAEKTPEESATEIIGLLS
ncbi:MAG: hypothetical protein ACFHXK_21010 [bacterium]